MMMMHIDRVGCGGFDVVCVVWQGSGMPRFPRGDATQHARLRYAASSRRAQAIEVLTLQLMGKGMGGIKPCGVEEIDFVGSGGGGVGCRGRQHATATT